MQYEVEIAGRVRQVSVHRTNGRFGVRVDGNDWSVDAVRVDGHSLSLLVGTASHEVTLVPDPLSGRLTVGVAGTPIAVGLNSQRRWGKKDDAGAEPGGPQRVLAPMPGKIVRVLVEVGASVRHRQPLIVIEAMKMENELRATRDGSVAEVLVNEGQSVDAGTLLLVVGPPR